jgi:tRNA 2-thiouridine synthesizing protein E
MSVLQVGEQRIELNDDGYMLYPEQWDEDVAVELARMNSVDPLTEDHWAVLRFVREYYLKYKVGPMVRLICRRTGLAEEWIHTLFQTCTRGCMCRIAGLPKPTG